MVSFDLKKTTIGTLSALSLFYYYKEFKIKNFTSQSDLFWFWFVDIYNFPNILYLLSNIICLYPKISFANSKTYGLLGILSIVGYSRANIFVDIPWSEKGWSDTYEYKKIIF